MSILSACLGKIKALSKENREYLEKQAADFEDDGMKPHEAAKTAAQFAIDETQETYKNLLASTKKTAPNAVKSLEAYWSGENMILTSLSKRHVAIAKKMADAGLRTEGEVKAALGKDSQAWAAPMAKWISENTPNRDSPSQAEPVGDAIDRMAENTRENLEAFDAETKRLQAAERLTPKAEPAKAPKKRRRIDSPSVTALYAHPFIAALREKGRIISKSAALKKMGKSEFMAISAQWNGSQGIGNNPVLSGVVYGGVQTPDKIADALHREGRLPEPTADALWNAIRSAEKDVKAKPDSDKRNENREWTDAEIADEVAKREEKEAASEMPEGDRIKELQDEGFDRANQEGPLRNDAPISADEMIVGQKITIDGEEMVVKVVEFKFNEVGDKVVDYVILKDGKRFGRQVLEGGEVVYEEREDEAQVKKAVPVSKMDIRNADAKELFGDDGGFKLGQQDTTDGDEVNAARKAKEEAKAAQDAAQGDIFSQTSPAPAPTDAPAVKAPSKSDRDIFSNVNRDQFTTPMMKEWLSVRDETPSDTIVLRQSGDFLETFADDAVVLAKHGNVALTKRNGATSAGIPVHAKEVYFEKLKAAGFKVKEINLSERKDATKPDSLKAAPLPITSLESTMAFFQRIRSGDTTADEIKQQWQTFKSIELDIKKEIAKKTMKELERFQGMRKPDNKVDAVRMAMDALHGEFRPSAMFSYSGILGGRDKMDDAKAIAQEKAVAAWTDETIQANAKERKNKAEARKKALESPETKDEWELFVDRKGRTGVDPETLKEWNATKSPSALNAKITARGESRLTPEQLANYDAIRGIDRKADEQARKEREATVRGVKADTDSEIVETKHTKTGADLFVVKLADRVEKDVYQSLNTAAKKMGGYYSSFRGAGAVPGFQFKDRATAEQFQAITKGETVDRSEAVQERQAGRKNAAAERLSAMADKMEVASEASLNADRKTNTAKRAREAGTAEASARTLKALATTMRNLANAIESGEATYLDGVRTKTHVDTLELLLRRANRESLSGLSYAERQRLDGEPTTAEQIDKAKYPYPFLNETAWQWLIENGNNTPGAKRLTARLEKAFSANPSAKTNGSYLVDQSGDGMIAVVKELLSKIRKKDYTRKNIEGAFESYDRVKAMGLNDLPMLRAALREFLQYRGTKAKADPIKEMERELVGMNIPGFFPTPPAIIKQMMDEAGDLTGKRVLEPSAGKGDLVDAATKAGAKVDAIEISPRLREILTAKGANVVDSDIMSFLPRTGTKAEENAVYDVVLMNPPFEDSQDADHVQTAFVALKPGGKLIAVMGEGVFGRSDRKAKSFRDWLDSMDGTSEKLPEGSFKSAFRPTGVNTRLVVIEKPSAALRSSPLPAASKITAAQDAEYLELAKDPEGNEEELQEMVDAAAKESDFNVGPLFHGSENFKGTSLENPNKKFTANHSFWFTNDIDLAEYYAGYPDEPRTLLSKDQAGPAILRFYIKSHDLELDRRDYEGEGFEEKSPVMDANLWLSLGRNQVIKITNIDDRVDSETVGDSTVYGIQNSGLARSADPVTYDESGKVIPLSERFNPASDSILRSAPLPAATPEIKEFIKDSKVVNFDGSPKKVYHGTPDVRGIIKNGFEKSVNRGNVFFFTDDYGTADTYANARRSLDYENAEPHTIPTYLSLKNPLEIDAKGEKWRKTELHIQKARDGGHDGIIIRNSRDEYNNISNGGKAVTVYAVFSPSQIKSASTGNLRSRVDGIDLGRPLFSTPLPADNLEPLKQRARDAFAKAEPKIKEAEAMIEAFGPGSLGTSPRFANFGGSDQLARNEVDIVRAFEQSNHEVRKDRDTFARAKELLAKDEAGVYKTALEGAFGAGDAHMGISDHQQLAIEMLAQKLVREANGDIKKVRDAQALIWANILNRKEQGRVLRIGFDKFMTPLERANQQLANLIFALHPKIEKRAKTMTYAERKAFFQQAGETRVKQVDEALMKAHGIRLAEVLKQRNEATSKVTKLEKEILKLKTIREQRVIQKIKAGATPADIKRLFDLSPEESAAILDSYRTALADKLRKMLQSGMTEAQIRESEKDSLQASSLNPGNAMTPAEVEAALARMIDHMPRGADYLKRKPITRTPKSKVKLTEEEKAHPLSTEWSRTEFFDGLKDAHLDAKDRAGIMSRVESIRLLTDGVGQIAANKEQWADYSKELERIKILTGEAKEKATKALKRPGLTGVQLKEAEAKMAEINTILAKYGSSAAEILTADKGIESYGFDPMDMVQMSTIARTINQIDADWVDKAVEFLYANMLWGPQTALVNMTAAGHAAYQMTAGRFVDASINLWMKDPMAAQFGEAKYVMRALAPALKRARSNFVASWLAQHPMVERDLLGSEVDWEAHAGGFRNKIQGGVIGGQFGNIHRTPLRVLTATDDFNKTLFGMAEAAAFAYRLAVKKGKTKGDPDFGMKPGDAKFEKFIRIEMNTAGSFSMKMGVDKASRMIFSNALPGQKNHYTGEIEPVNDIGGVIGKGASKLNDFVSGDHDNIAAKIMLALLRISFFPFQRTPFNIVRQGMRYAPNPISLTDIGIGIFSNNRQLNAETGKMELKRNAQGRNNELLERASQQLQGAILLSALVALGWSEGDDDDQDKGLVITGTAPWSPAKRAEKDARERAGVGAYRVSWRREDGSERAGFSYARIEPIATSLSTVIDTIRTWKRIMKNGGDASDIMSNLMGGLVAQTKDKTFLRGFGDLFDLITNTMAADDIKEPNQRKMNQFLVGKIAMVMPNIIKQPLREADSSFRERSDSFGKELVYQLFPYGQKAEKVSPIGGKLEKPKATGNETADAAIRTLDVTDSGTTKVDPVDQMLLRWRDSRKWESAAQESNRKPWFPSPIISAEFKHTKTGVNVKMTGPQLTEFRQKAGQRASALLKSANLNTKNPSERDVEKAKELISKARSDMKAALRYKFSQ